jgi:hypothetical protein
MECVPVRTYWASRYCLGVWDVYGLVVTHRQEKLEMQCGSTRTSLWKRPGLLWGPTGITV